MGIKQYLDKIKRSKDTKTLLSNFGYLSLLQVAGYMFPLITLPYLSRVIGVDGFGKIAFASVVIVWIQTIADWGFNFTATRDVAKNRDDTERVSEIFSNVLWARCLLMVVSFVFLVLLTILIPKFKENQAIILITFLLVPGHIMFPDWFFQAMERMKYITILNILSKTLFTVAVFIFVKQKSDYILQPLLTSLGYLIAGIIAMYYILVIWKIRLCKPNFKSILYTIKGSTDVFVNNLTPNLYNSFSVLLLGFFSGTTSNGILDGGSKLVTACQQFMVTLSRTFFPFLSRRIDKHSIYARINIILSFLFSVVLFVFAPLLIRMFFTDEFSDSILVLRIMSFSIFFLSLSNIYGTNYMIIQGCEKQLRNITFFCSLIGFCMTFPLIYYFDFIGAALTITITRGLLGGCIMLKARKIKKAI